MHITLSKTDIAWSYLGYLLRFGSNLLVLPIVLKMLPSTDLGIWYAFSSIGGLVILLDFGFSPTILRNISYSWAGAREIRKQGVAPLSDLREEPSLELMHRIIQVSRRLYLLVSSAASVLMLTVGSLYIHNLAAALDNHASILLAWLVYCCATFVTIGGYYWPPVLTGMGLIKETQKSTAASQFLYIAIAAAGLLLRLGIISMSIAFLASGILLRIASRHYFYTPAIIREKYSVMESSMKQACDWKLFRAMWHNTYRMGISTVGAYFILQSNTILCSRYLGLNMTASYGLSLQFFSTVANFSGILFRSYLPVFNEARVKNDTERLKKYLSVSVVIAWVSFAACGLAVILLGDWAVRVMGSNTALLNKGILTFMFLYLFLEFNHSQVFAAFITTENKVPFVWPSLVSGILVAGLSWTLVTFTDLGIWALLLSQFIVQLAYNNWKWPYKVLKEMNMTIDRLLLTGCSHIIKKLSGYIVEQGMGYRSGVPYERMDEFGRRLEVMNGQICELKETIALTSEIFQAEVEAQRAQFTEVKSILQQLGKQTETIGYLNQELAIGREKCRELNQRLEADKSSCLELYAKIQERLKLPESGSKSRSSQHPAWYKAETSMLCTLYNLERTQLEYAYATLHKEEERNSRMEVEIQEMLQELSLRLIEAKELDKALSDCTTQTVYGTSTGKR